MTTEETCTSSEGVGRYAYVVVEGDDAFSGVTLECNTVGGSAHPPTPPPTPSPTEVSGLANGVPMTGLSGIATSKVQYTLPVPSNAESVTCSIGGGSGDADLKINWDADVDFNDNGGGVNAVSQNGSSSPM